MFDDTTLGRTDILQLHCQAALMGRAMVGLTVPTRPVQHSTAQCRGDRPGRVPRRSPVQKPDRRPQLGIDASGEVRRRGRDLLIERDADPVEG